mmetsp:Transcript_33723/g.43279  ORF Transcript_33723/g.43279 Transcript_33723/m.43279 type:complete len:230 (+) Transcript_33723:68-757(+)|eukprot:CAMPEP_0117754074 /NCGR_PEP_ID=MMETSP0947-20121206/12614_1 /TAXON_ID=44440 /ORGANISM="Chattonella subsalsa, Strain CCMP2191" /LENGTH=229 /DNA_ID=CAMNT_0005573097 /DNA_START=74 /DNA_END=763 /DNA_ORIENTATION=-
MTLYHFLNCALLTYGPFAVTYMATSLQEDVPRICVKAGFIYIASQLVKMIVMASYVPDIDPHSFSIVQEAIELVLSVVDVVGLMYAFRVAQQVSSQNKALAVGWGWAVTQAVLSRLLPLFLNAKGSEFHWENLQGGVAANVDYLRVLGLAMLCYLASPKKKETGLVTQGWVSLLPFTALLLVTPTAFHYVRSLAIMSEWEVLAVDAVVVLLVDVIIRMIYLRSTKKKDN